MGWLQLTLSIHPEQETFISGILDTLGAQAITLQDGANQPLFEPAPDSTPLWQQTQITGLFADDVNTEALIQELQQHLPQLPEYQLEHLADQEWSKVWLKDFQPMSFGERLWICPSAYTPPHADAVNLLLDPGLAFGTGTHPTTALCLQWLDKNLHTDGKPFNIIDYGCGSGILAIAALKLGASHAIAVDNDPQALEATIENAKKNELAERIQTLTPKQHAQDVLTTNPVPLLMANILANPLIDMAEKLATYVQSGGNIVLSGILQEQTQDITAAYAPWFDFKQITQQQEWICLEGRKK